MAVLQAVHAVFAYLALHRNTTQVVNRENDVNGKRDHSLLLKALRARRKVRQRRAADGTVEIRPMPDMNPEIARSSQQTGKYDET